MKYQAKYTPAIISAYAPKSIYNITNNAGGINDTINDIVGSGIIKLIIPFILNYLIINLLF